MKNAIRKTIELANSGRKVAAATMVRQDPDTAALISKMVQPQLPPTYDHQGQRAPTAPQINAFKNVSQHTAQNIGDAETVMQIQPDMKLAREILVSSIQSPKDLMTTALTYGGPEGLMAPHLLAAMVARSQLHFEEDYKIEPLIGDILEDSLFNTGSYAVAVIPENSIDDAINSPRHMSMESFADHIDPRTGMIKNLGILGDPVKKKATLARSGPGLSLESFSDPQIDPSDGRVTFEGIMEKPHDDTYLHVTDNPHVLKIPQINQKIRENQVTGMLGIQNNLVALESAMTQAMRKEGMSPLTDRELTALVYKDNQYGHQPITSLKTQEQLARRTVGNPLILHLPSEAVIPVFIPGTPDEQIGFFVLIDADGNPVSRTSNTDYYQELTSRLNSNGSFPSAMLTKVRSMMSGFPSVNANATDYSVRYYQEIVEADLLARLRNGRATNGVQLATNQEVYRIMLSRVLAKKYTQLLFIPVELMTYFAFDYTPDGVGQSLLDDMKVLNSLRAMLTFANVMAGIKNSIGRTNVALTLDPEDPDPKKTIELATHEIVRSRQQYFPLGMNSPTDLVDWLQRSGFEFTWEGHPGVPALKIDFTEKHSEYVKPDTDLVENLDKKAIMATGLSPDNIDAAFHAEFATSIVQNNILLSKRVVKYQVKFEPQLADHARKVMMTSERLLTDLRKILSDNFDQLIVDKHDLKDSENQAQAVQAQAENNSHKEFLEAANKAVANQQGEPNAVPTTPVGNVEAPTEGTPYAAATGEGGAPVVKVKPVEGEGKESVEVSEHKKRFIVETILMQFIRGFTIKLPRPNSVSLENQMNAMKAYTDALDAALEAWISTEFFTSALVGTISEDVDAIKKSVRAYFLRKWMAENGFMTELSQLTAADKDGKPMIDVFGEHKSHIEGLVRSFTEDMVKLTVVKNASDKILAETGAGGPPADTGGEGGGTSDDNAFPGLDDNSADTTGGAASGEGGTGEPTEPAAGEGGAAGGAGTEGAEGGGGTEPPEEPEATT